MTSGEDEDHPSGGVVGGEPRATPRISASSATSSRSGHDSAAAAPAQILPAPILPSETRRKRTGRREKNQQKPRGDGTPPLPSVHRNFRPAKKTPSEPGLPDDSPFTGQRPLISRPGQCRSLWLVETAV
ncbi:hypothetical protein MTO96_009990 [Rhipicephalus appendiculatus]